MIHTWLGESGREVDVVRQLGPLVGDAVEGVAYLHMGDDDYPGTADDFDAVTMGVELSLRSGGVFGVRWVPHPAEESLGFWFGVLEHGLWRWPVPASSPWHTRLSSPVTGTTLAWHVANEFSSVSAWSLRLDFQSAPPVVIALGAPDLWGRTRLTYMSDDVAVIFDEGLARSYRPPAARSSAWGDDGP